MAVSDPDFDAWVQRARSSKIEDLVSILGIPSLRKAGGELVGPCPRCGGTDRFAINPKDQVYNCRGAGGGDGIAMVMHIENIPFVEACEFILNEPPPRADAAAPAKPMDDRIARERAEDRENSDREREASEVRTKARKAVSSSSIFDTGGLIFGTQAEEYYRERKIILTREMAVDLRYVRKLEYRGYADRDAAEEVSLGEFPCIVAAMRDLSRNLVGIHRTYLDLKKPIKLKPPGDESRNMAKKMFGQKGLIHLGPTRPVMAVAEGIETSFSWGALALVPDDFCLAAAGDLGNMAGGWTDTAPHPTIARRSIPNGIPDPEKPGMAIPAEVRELILLGDGDSDPANTWAHVLTAARRHRSMGRTISVHFAPRGKDWNDVLKAVRASEKSEAA